MEFCQSKKMGTLTCHLELNTIFERGSSKIIENVFLLVNIFTLTLDMEKISMQRENRVSSKNSVDLRMLTAAG